MSAKRSLIVQLRAMVYAIAVARFNVFILLFGSVLLFVDQGQDLLLETLENNQFGRLLGGAMLWALSIWYWARLLLDIRFPDPPVDYAALAWWREYLPRLLGALAFAGLAWNLYRAGGWNGQVLMVIVSGVIYYLLVQFRRPLLRRYAKWRMPDHPERHWAWSPDLAQAIEPQQRDFRALITRPWVLGLLLLGLFMLAWGLTNPLGMGLFFDTLVLLFVWGATFLPLGSLITYIGNRYGVPLFLLLIVLALFSSLSNDNHSIRPLTAGQASAQRPSFSAAVEQWARDNHCGAKSCPPFVVVATAGGGIRAAYWTATLLGHLQDHPAIDRFDQRLFAISGVSGGSLGATVYRAVLETDTAKGKVMTTSQAVLAQDFLTPLSAGLLYPDLLQRFIPVAVFEDRASVFEQGLEHAFEAVTGEDRLKQSFVALSSDHAHHRPGLFLNATWSGNGRRIVAAGFDMRAQPKVLFSDLIGVLGHDMRLSTAAHNSARFPFASPPGSWQQQTDDGPLLQRLQDGGLFENFGAETALEILNAARVYFKQHDLKFDPLVILISSDPTLGPDLATPPVKPPANLAYEVMTTFRTYGATRVGRGALAASRLKNWIRSEQRFVYLRMCDSETPPPLGWALSQPAQRAIEGYLFDLDDRPAPSCRADNQRGIAQLRSALAKDD